VIQPIDRLDDPVYVAAQALLDSITGFNFHHQIP
jgi:hypothetical protein